MSKRVKEIVVLVTASSQEEAGRIGHAVVEARLAACANMIPAIRSLFWWEGKVADEQEVLIILKSREDLFEELATTVKKLHSYRVPEVIAFPIVQGAKEYLAWIQNSTRKPLKNKGS